MIFILMLFFVKDLMNLRLPILLIIQRILIIYMFDATITNRMALVNESEAILNNNPPIINNYNLI